MSFAYSFPAVKGQQADQEYYIAMVPMKYLSKLFPDDEEIVPPEFRAQRQINEARIPEIKQYILKNRGSYVFSALSASIDGEFKFISNLSENTGILEIDFDAKFLINDGQHRKAAIEAAIIEDETLGNETISIVFFRDKGLKRSQQMFTDLNKHAVKTSNSLSTLYDSRDSVAVATKNLIEKIPFFKRFTDKERDILGKNSSNLFTLNSMYKANQKIIHGKCQPSDEDFLYEYWKCVSNNITEWQDVLNKDLTKKSLREDYIVTFAITLSSFGRLGRYFYEHKDLEINKYLANLKKVDWSRSNEDWLGRTIRENGKVNNSEEAIVLTCSKIKTLIGIELSKEEKNKELQFNKH